MLATIDSVLDCLKKPSPGQEEKVKITVFAYLDAYVYLYIAYRVRPPQRRAGQVLHVLILIRVSCSRFYEIYFRQQN